MGPQIAELFSYPSIWAAETGHLIWIYLNFPQQIINDPDPQILLLMWLHRSHSSQVKETMLFVLPTGKERVFWFSPGTTVLPLPSHLPPHLLTKPAASFIHSCHAGTTLYETQGSGTWNSRDSISQRQQAPAYPIKCMILNRCCYSHR